MLKALLKARLQALWAQMFTFGRAGKRRGPGMKLLIALLALYIIASLGFSVGAMFDMLYVPYRDAGLRPLYHAMCALAAFVMSFVGSVFLAQSTLYDARDNETLLSLPIPPRLILSSRAAVLMLFILAFQQLILLPSAAVWLLHGPVSAGGIVMYLLTSVLLPLPALALSLLGGWLLARLTARVRRKSLAVTLLSLVFLGAYFAVFSQLPRFLSRLIAQGEQLARAFEKALFPFWHYGLAVAEGRIGSLALFALAAVLPLAAVLWLVARNYLRILTTRRGAPRVEYRGGGLDQASPKATLLKKELRRIASSPVWMLNTGLGLVFMLALPVLLLVNLGTLSSFLAQAGLTGAPLEAILPVLLCLMAAMSMVSAPSVSMEGKALWILQSLPVRPLDALMAKLKAHLILCLPPALLSAAACALLLRIALPLAIALCALPALMTLITGLLGLLANLKFPKFDWNHETEPVKQGLSVIFTMLGGFSLSAAPAALYVLVFQKTMGLAVFAGLTALFYALVCAGLALLLRRWGPRAFAGL